MGLMLGMSFDFPVAELRKNLLFRHKIFTGSAGDKNTMRLLPSLAVTKEELNQFLEALKIELNNLC
jgi:acetylornithine aminotransferase